MVDSNLLVLFHGLGDKMENFAKFGQHMNLPQTSCLCIQAPVEILDFGYMWYNVFDDEGEIMEYDENRLGDIIEIRENLILFFSVLNDKCGWSYDSIFLFGYCQGGTVAIDLILNWPHRRLGGCIAVSDSVLDEYMKKNIRPTSSQPPSLPMLVTHGKRDPSITVQKATTKYNFLCERLKGTEMEFKVYEKGNEMPKGKDEVYDIMTFFSKYLLKRSIHMENLTDVVEITGEEKARIMKQMTSKK